MAPEFADRMKNIHQSFVREILKVTDNPEVISFAGGLPNPESFPVEAVKEASDKVLSEDGTQALQYSTSEGYQPLRGYIAQRYYKNGLKVDSDNILITNGSQQCIDLVGKVFVNQGDKVILERPTYLAAIQALGLYQPEFREVPLEEDGVDINALEKILTGERIKMFYAITNFQNPTGITYSQKKREEVAEILQNQDTVFVEDNPYGEIRFMGENLAPVNSYLTDGVLFGSFSKIVAPGMRMGWIVASDDIMDNLVIAKQASDLHSNYFTQRVVYQFLQDNNMDQHVQKIRNMYRKQRDLMIRMIQEHFPPEVQYTQPEGGMFIWVTLPLGLSSMNLFDLAIKEDVAFVPGEAFYVNDAEKNTLRLNFSNSDREKIEEGIKRLGKAIEKLMA
jgi:2-aminoadipate transaminase